MPAAYASENRTGHENRFAICTLSRIIMYGQPPRGPSNCAVGARVRPARRARLASERAPDPLRSATRGAGYGRPLVALGVRRVRPASGPPAGRDWHRSAPLTRFDPQLEGLATAGPSLHWGCDAGRPGPARAPARDGTPAPPPVVSAPHVAGGATEEVRCPIRRGARRGPIARVLRTRRTHRGRRGGGSAARRPRRARPPTRLRGRGAREGSEEHTSELQSPYVIS